ncbi:Nulp1-pending protein [Magnaporthiopsis poae ATCC 64411]|uniref:Nulp1-pending protein n=1 Tax=Magnaporthiopsis poae (strain ATCC 64411 / 73-15) TaxID=644358 RepID=A0A0C4DK01_MAGP6|nr:Nulp1-pending protein [Magnaporthiopsis poae ATCC 64411]
MSSRQLRKLLAQQEELRKQQELDQQDAPADVSDNDEPIIRPPRANMFSGFASLVDDGGDDDDDDGDDAEQQTTTTKPADEPITVPSKKSKKKSKRKKKAKKADPEPPADDAPEKNGMDEIDRALEQLRVAEPTSVDTSKSGPTDRYEAELAKLLSINTVHLKVVNEMRNLFGRDAMTASSADSDPQVGQDLRALRREGQTLEQYLKGRPDQKISEVLLRRNPFVEGKSYWPKAPAGGLTMKQVERLDDSDGSTEFAFAHDKGYDGLEAVFFQCVQTHDPMMLVHFLHTYPYHVSSLIQVSKIAKQDQNSALAGDLCERALFTFGRVTLSAFRNKLKEGRARLSFSRPENRQFWLAAYNYVRSLMIRGTYRTALEWAKMLLSFSPADEYGMLNLIHVIAIRCHEAAWFLELVCENDLFGYFMARHVPNREYIRQTAVLAKLQLGDAAGAKKQLAEGMETLPWLYCALFGALNMDAPKSIWGIQPRSRTEELYTGLYISQAKDVWNNPQASALLKEVAAPLKRPPAYETLPEAEDVAESTARLVYLDNTPSLMTLVPHALMHASPNFDFDPLPPPLEENVFSSVAQRLPWEGTQPDPSTLQIRDVFARLFPAQGPGDPEAPEQQDGPLGTQQEENDAMMAELRAAVAEAGDDRGVLARLARLAEFMFGRPPDTAPIWVDETGFDLDENGDLRREDPLASSSDTEGGD